MLACAGSSREEGLPTFFYSSLLFSVSKAAGPLSSISVSKSIEAEESTNGKVTFGSPLIAVAKDANTHSLDKDWMAVNPVNPRSTDGGATWSAPAQVDTNPEPIANGLGTDSYMPRVAVDPTSGEVGVCWYDRRNDPLNYKVQRFCGDSFDAGATLTNIPMNPTPFAPIHATDDQVNPFYFGDYDTVSSDGFLSTAGFIGAFQIVSAQGGKVLVPNPDVFARNFN